MKKFNIILFLMLLGIVFALPSLLLNNNLKLYAEYTDDIDFDYENVKLSEVSGKIHIDNNWTDARDAEICTGNGTYSDPYVIEDLEIDGEGSGSCIFIENSDVYFRIENCTLYNAGAAGSAGIRLSNVDNSQLIDNNCSSNVRGLHLESSDNNTISENIVNYNSWIGIRLIYSDNNIISGNTANNNDNGILSQFCSYNNISTNIFKNNTNVGIYSSNCNYYNISGNTVDKSEIIGIYFDSCNYSIISGNVANNSNYGISCLNDCRYNMISENTLNNNTFSGIYLASWSHNNNITGNTANNNTHGINIDGTYNIISGNTANNNTYGIYLGNYYNTISGNTANNNTYGIYLSYSNYNTISGNVANNNSYGIYLTESHYNIISGNTLLGNEQCIVEENCQGNEFSDNGSCTYGEVDKKPVILGYNLFFLLGILSVVAILISKKLKKM